jgi:hypothetical protein
MVWAKRISAHKLCLSMVVLIRKQARAARGTLCVLRACTQCARPSVHFVSLYARECACVCIYRTRGGSGRIERKAEKGSTASNTVQCLNSHAGIALKRMRIDASISE